MTENNSRVQQKNICLKRIRSYDTGEERGASRHFFASNDKNRINLKLIILDQLKWISDELFRVLCSR